MRRGAAFSFFRDPAGKMNQVIAEYCPLYNFHEARSSAIARKEKGACETLCGMKLCEQFKQSAQALELLHERKMWNEQKPFCLSEAS